MAGGRIRKTWRDQVSSRSPRASLGTPAQGDPVDVWLSLLDGHVIFKDTGLYWGVRGCFEGAERCAGVPCRRRWWPMLGPDATALGQLLVTLAREGLSEELRSIPGLVCPLPLTRRGRQRGRSIADSCGSTSIDIHPDSCAHHKSRSGRLRRRLKSNVDVARGSRINGRRILHRRVAFVNRSRYEKIVIRQEGRHAHHRAQCRAVQLGRFSPRSWKCGMEAVRASSRCATARIQGRDGTGSSRDRPALRAASKTSRTAASPRSRSSLLGPLRHRQ